MSVGVGGHHGVVRTEAQVERKLRFKRRCRFGWTRGFGRRRRFEWKFRFRTEPQARGGPSTSRVCPEYVEPTSVTIHDWNRDGRDDLAVATRRSDALALLTLPAWSSDTAANRHISNNSRDAQITAALHEHNETRIGNGPHRGRRVGCGARIDRHNKARIGDTASASKKVRF